MTEIPKDFACWDKDPSAIQTRYGKFDPIHPDPKFLDINDIAHALSQLCRYGGHTSQFYSVAQHSILVSSYLPQEYCLWGLMHDATEAYLCDLPRPIKMFSKIGEPYREIEQRLMEVIAARFGLSMPIPEIVKHMDNWILLAEARDLLEPRSWQKKARQAFPATYQFHEVAPILPLDCLDAKHIFLERFTTFYGGN